MKPSLFAPNGLLLLKGGKPLAEAIHSTVVRLFTDGTDGAAFSSDVGSFVDCFSFALARVVARAQRRHEQVTGEMLAQKVYFLLAQLEEEHGLRPAYGDTLKQRRDALLVRLRAREGSRRPALEQALMDLLGDTYVGIHVADPATEVSVWPETLGDSPQMFGAPNMPRKLVRISNAISVMGSQPVTYVPVDPDPVSDTEQTVLVGDQLVVGVENLGTAETVTVTGVSLSGEGDGDRVFVATFTKAHEPNCLAVAMPFPAWGSSQRHIWVVLTEDAALDADTRRKTHETMARMVTGITTWSICPQTTGAAAGPWTLDHPVMGALDMNPMGLITVP